MTDTGKSLLLSLGSFGSRAYLNEHEMGLVRTHLTSVGAACTDEAGTVVESCHGRYTQQYYRETWTSPQGHNLLFRFCGPNPVGPQQNGWSVARESRCPEWTEALAERRALYEAASQRLEEMSD
jgi:hypothetical protein